jgi:nicotinate-nucleotide pyrophosphorylase (carboxylating)
MKVADDITTLWSVTADLITAERMALNLLQRPCGIATVTDKYAVTTGGGSNHRLTLAAMVLLEENHVTAVEG